MQTSDPAQVHGGWKIGGADLRRGVLAFGIAVLITVVISATASGTGHSGPGVRWGGHLFASPAGLQTWLGERGASYDAWVLRHRLAAARLEGRPPPERKATPSAVPAQAAAAQSTKPAAATGTMPTSPRPAVAHGGSGDGYLVWLLVAVALGAIVLAVAPLPSLHWSEPVRAHRLDIAAAGLAVLIGLGIGRMV